ncbi:MAG: hypothetical protein ACI9HK_003363, partial [Pirellulaceae bacterium]
MTRYDFKDLKKKHHGEPFVCALLDQIEIITSECGGLNEQSRQQIVAQAQRLSISNDRLATLFDEIETSRSQPRTQAFTAGSKTSHSGNSKSRPQATSEDELLDLLMESNTIPATNNTSTGKRPSSQVESQMNIDPLVREFVRQAEPIIARERGINGRSQAQLDELATELELTREQTELGFALLSGRNIEQTVEVKPRPKRFHDHVRDSLRASRKREITFADEQVFLDVAAADFGLDRPNAGQILHRVCDELNIDFISQQEALRLIKAEFEKHWPHGTTLGEKTRLQIYEGGIRLGLSDLQLRSVEKDIAERRQSRRESMATRSNIIVASAMWVVLAAACIICVVALTHRENKSADADPPPLPQYEGRGWWDRQMTLDVMDARNSLRSTHRWLESLIDQDESARNDSYKSFFGIDPAANTYVSPQLTDRTPEEKAELSRLVAGLIALEP